MSSAAFLPFTDDDERLIAIDPRRSFTVQAPAGSGKTELLIQRFLSLLATVEKPETIVAITFTRKAAAEMRERILKALKDAAKNDPVAKSHQQRTRDLALAALERDARFGWGLLNHPSRLRIETIDALSMSITGAMPWLARLGAMPQIQDDNAETYDEAARLTVLDLDGDDEYAQALELLLGHLDNDAVQLRALIADMLQKRDQWMDLAFSPVEDERHILEATLERALHREIVQIEQLIPDRLREPWWKEAKLDCWPRHHDNDGWIQLRDSVLTKSNKKDWRVKGVRSDLIQQLRGIDGLREALLRVEYLPPVQYDEQQWEILRALLTVLRRAVAQLKQVFRERGVVDFTEIGQAARRALTEAGSPTELAYHLDSRIDHLLIDEFQDTSRGQFELIEQLIWGWEPDDGRTLFLVGDPMQSIYRFRQAEVSLFLHVRNRGIGSLRPESLTLRSNYRTALPVLEKINNLCADIFPKTEDIETGRIAFAPCDAEVKDVDCEWRFQAVASPEEEARRVLELIHAARARNPEETVAVLVRARTHLDYIVKALKEADLAFQAVDVDVLSGRPVVQDLLALTRAILHPVDRVSWLAILRAPWCGLTLEDMETLVRARTNDTIWSLLQGLSSLSEDGRLRATRVRDVLKEALDSRASWTLRRLVERTWIKLGGPACLAGDPRQMQDANDYFDLLEREQTGCELRDFDAFPSLVEKLFSRPDPNATESLQVMTIHAAKGLEFDTVILPGLERRDRKDDNSLFLFHEWPGERGATERLLAPIHPASGENDGIYRYIRKIEDEKRDNERLRLFYVAMTRAKRRLYLFGCLSQKTDGSLSAGKGSMLKDILHTLTPEEMTTCDFTLNSDQTRSEKSGAGISDRLSLQWQLPSLPKQLTWDGAGPKSTEPHDPTFEWVGESLRIAGTVVHSYLQRIQGTREPLPDAKSIRAVLAHAGLSEEEIPMAAKRVAQALESTLKSDRGRWILDSHQDAKSEYAVSGVVDGQVVFGKIDRTFIDRTGTRWIVDFKTSSHEGANIEGFLDEQQRRYSDQMLRYARIMAAIGNPVRLGLYFPLLDQWREWSPEIEPRT